MARKNECIAMLLAGGQGSRLGILTHKIAKPAVPFGGKYRIIDFPLSTCVNSGIYTVGVLTQYPPLELNDYVGTGDHIYKMDYADMLAFHKKQEAACTIAMREVEWKEASRFGLMLVNDDSTISEFEEKPENPRSNKASMGIYIFTWSKLREYLIADENDPNSSNDFGHNVIPAMHEAGEKMVAYQFDGYWRDVGTIESLWEANMDILSPVSGINLNDPHWKIYARSPSAAPQFISDKAEVGNSMVTEGCSVEGKVDFSVLFPNATVEEGSNVKYSIIMPGAVVKKGADVQYAIVAENAVVEEGAKVGAGPDTTDPDKWGVAVIGEGITIGKNAIIPANVMVNENVEEGTNYESK